MNPLMLIIDTAHPTARIFLADEEKMIVKREWENTPKVGTDLLLYIDEALREVGKEKTDITRIAVHAGPGSYGLVRTGIVTGTVLAQALEAQLVEVIGDSDDELIKSARTGEIVESIEPKYRE